MSATPAVPSNHRKFGKCVYVPSNFINSGRISIVTAETILAAAIEAWEINASTDTARNELLNNLAISLRPGTSAERKYVDNFFKFGDESLTLGHLEIACRLHYNGENAVRVFARSFNNGELAARLHAALSETENVVLRNQAAFDYGVSVEFAAVCFDFADALIDYAGINLSQMDRHVIQVNTASKVRTSRSAIMGGADGGSVQQMTDSNAAGTSSTSSANLNRAKTEAAAPGSFQQRAAFPPMR